MEPSPETNLILIIEDDPGLAILEEELLAANGWESRQFSYGREALDWLAANTPSLILLDYGLPDINGLDFLALAGKAGISLPPFIVATGMGDERTAVTMMKLGASEYLIKDSQFLEILPVAIRKTLEHFHIERQLSASQNELRRLASAVEQSVESIIIVEPNGLIEYVNPAFEKITGYSKSECVGQTPRPLKSGAQDNEFYENLWNTIISGEVWFGRFVNRRKDGTLFHEEASISPVFGIDGGITHFVAVKKDITKEIELQSQLRQSQKMEAIGLLAGGIAHDLNNLLIPILGYSEIMMLDDDLHDRYIQDLRQIIKAGNKARDLVGQLMAFSRKQVLDVKPVDVNKIIIGFETLLRRTLREDISIQLCLNPLTNLIRADCGQMEQVIMNLAVNAQDAMPHGGSLTITTSEVVFDTLKQIPCNDITPGTYIHMVISDTGHGIDKEIQTRIFEPFFTTKEIGKGTGLGLATAYGIVQQHGGSIHVESQPGQGTQFHIWLPAFEALESHESVSECEPIMAMGNETILVAEDDPDVHDVVCVMLRTLGYNILNARSAEECLEIARKNHNIIDLLITDVVMPQMNGKELYSHLQQIAPNAKALFMSGHTADIITERGILEEGLHFIQKPFNIEMLSRKIRMVFNS